MSLYLCVFDDDGEVEGVEVGLYADFGDLRNTVYECLEDGERGSRFPMLMLHSDCDGEWSPSDAARLAQEVREISAEFETLEPKPFNSDWQRSVAKLVGLKPKNLSECFIDVDGEPLLERLAGLADIATSRDLPILFQ